MAEEVLCEVYCKINSVIELWWVFVRATHFAGIVNFAQSSGMRSYQFYIQYFIDSKMIRCSHFTGVFITGATGQDAGLRLLKTVGILATSSRGWSYLCNPSNPFRRALQYSTKLPYFISSCDWLMVNREGGDRCCLRYCRLVCSTELNHAEYKQPRNAEWIRPIYLEQ